MVSAINVNFRLTYLKETVMTYYLFQEDPTFIFINNVIQSNNYIIVSTLFAKHHQQFINLLTQLPQNVHQISQFLAEFYMVFIRLPQHVHTIITIIIIVWVQEPDHRPRQEEQHVDAAQYGHQGRHPRLAGLPHRVGAVHLPNAPTISVALHEHRSPKIHGFFVRINGFMLVVLEQHLPAHHERSNSHPPHGVRYAHDPISACPPHQPTLFALGGTATTLTLSILGEVQIHTHAAPTHHHLLRVAARECGQLPPPAQWGVLEPLPARAGVDETHHQQAEFDCLGEVLSLPH